MLASYAHRSEVAPRNLDTAFAAWNNDGSPQKAPAEDAAQGLGALSGSLVVTRKQADWVVVTDSFGTEPAARSAKGGDLLPIASVWKRIDPKNGDIKFFEPIWTLVVDNLDLPLIDLDDASAVPKSVRWLGPQVPIDLIAFIASPRSPGSQSIAPGHVRVPAS